MSDFAGMVVDNFWLWTSLAGLLLASVAFLLAAARSDWSALLVMATVPVQRELLLGRDSTQLTWTQIALAAFFAGALLRFARGDLTLRIDGVAIAAGAVLVLYGMSVLVAEDLGDWAAETYRWGVAVLFLVLARNYFTRESSLRLVIVLVAWIAMAGLWAFVQVAFEQGPSSFVRGGLMRAHGAFGEPNPFGAFAWAITLPVIAYAVLHRESRAGLRWACALAGVGGMVVLALTQSRGGVLGALGGLAVIAFMLIARRRERTLLTGTIAVSLVAAAGIAVVVVAEPWSEMDQATTPANWANQERTAHWAAASEMIKQNPVSGVGAGGFGDHYRDATRFWRFRISQGHAHNAYLQVAAEIGLPGLLAYGLLLASILGSLIRRSLDLDQRWLAVGVAAVTVALVIHQLVDFLHVLSLGVLFAGLWAAALPAGNKGIPSREHNIAP